MADLNSIFQTCIVLLSVILVDCDSNSLSRGWGDEINWIANDDALRLAAQNNQPIMMLIHKSWCGACKALKPLFAAKQEIMGLSHQFIMVNVQDDEEPTTPEYSPDGGYIPRIIFLDHKGTVLTEFYNERGNKKYKYYYSSPDDIVTSMKNVLKKLQSTDHEKSQNEL